MLNKLTATQKGLLTGLLLILIELVFLLINLPMSGPHQYIIYVVYTAGIVLTLWSAAKKNGDGTRFKFLFNEGFRYFIVVTLVMVVYTFIFLKLNHQFRDAYAAAVKAQLLADGNKTPAEIETFLADMKSRFALVFTGFSVFIYLFLGALITAIASAYITRNKFNT